MANSISILTEQSKTLVGDATASLQGNILAHVNGDWGYHNAMRVYSTPFNQTTTGGAVSPLSLRMLVTSYTGTANFAVIVPCLLDTAGGGFVGGGPPILINGPSSLSLPVGSPAQFTVEIASQTVPLFQWSKNAVAITGANAALYRITSVTTLDAGTYVGTVSNSYGSVYSNGAILSVLTSSSGAGSTQLPIISYQQPNPVQTITVNRAVSSTFLQLSIDVASDSAVSFTWQKNGSNIVYTPDLGAPTTYLYAQSWAGHAHGSVLTLQLRPGHPADAGQYSVICTNANGSVISAVWVITVI